MCFFVVETSLCPTKISYYVMSLRNDRLVILDGKENHRWILLTCEYTYTKESICSIIVGVSLKFEVIVFQ